MTTELLLVIVGIVGIAIGAVFSALALKRNNVTDTSDLARELAAKTEKIKDESQRKAEELKDHVHKMQVDYLRDCIASERRLATIEKDLKVE